MHAIHIIAHLNLEIQLTCDNLIMQTDIFTHFPLVSKSRGRHYVGR